MKLSSVNTIIEIDNESRYTIITLYSNFLTGDIGGLKKSAIFS